MIYAVGLIAKYDATIAAGVGIKLGRHRRDDGADVHGGWVWRTAAEAQAYLAARNALDTRRVYGVLADWDTDTYDASGEPTRCLLRDAVLVRLE